MFGVNQPKPSEAFLADHALDPYGPCLAYCLVDGHVHQVEMTVRVDSRHGKRLGCGWGVAAPTGVVTLATGRRRRHSPSLAIRASSSSTTDASSFVNNGVGAAIVVPVAIGVLAQVAATS